MPVCRPFFSKQPRECGFFIKQNSQVEGKREEDSVDSKDRRPGGQTPTDNACKHADIHWVSHEPIESDDD